jgi:hypothetical protein
LKRVTRSLDLTPPMPPRRRLPVLLAPRDDPEPVPDGWGCGEPGRRSSPT